jgi:hypothetical protein
MWISIPAAALIAVNLAAHALGGLNLAFGLELSPLARLGAHHYAHMAVLSLLLLMAQNVREHLRPALAALTALVLAATLAPTPPGRLGGHSLELLAIPLLWCLTALTAASAAAAAVPPPEERPGLNDFKRAVLAINIFNCGLLALLHKAAPGPWLHPGCLSTGLSIMFSGWLLVAAGRWANLAYIAGLAAAMPALTALFVLSARPPWPLEIFALAYGLCADFHMALLSILSALVALISLAIKAGVRLSGRVRRPVRPLARSVSLFPVLALVMAAALSPGMDDRPEASPQPFIEDMKALRLADLALRVPATWEVGPVRYRLPLAGQTDRLILAERAWATEAEMESDVQNIRQRLSDNAALPDAGLGGDRQRLFLRPAWLVVTSTPPVPPNGPAAAHAFKKLDLELYLLYPGGGLKLAAAFDYEARASRAQDYESFAQHSVEQFIAAAVDIVGRYRWLGAEGQASPGDFRTVFGAFDRPVPGLLMEASISGQSEAAGEPPVFSSREDWSERPNRIAPDEDLQQAESRSVASLSLRWGGTAPTAVERFSDPAVGPGRISAFPALNRGLLYYQGSRRLPSRPLVLAGRPGRLESRSFHHPPLRPATEPWEELSLSWTADGSGGPPLSFKFIADLQGQTPEARARQSAAALSQWQAVADSLRPADAPQ